ncbi:hypothetical protein [Micromonospora sp. SH-82]|uniref:hypothetical protein n=1 Tax=Micromonospora sp. SH-82 TaxID=3132938 RepID=UPI003EB92F66
MGEDAYPFFVGPHRFDAYGEVEGPVLDRRYELVPDFGERILGRYRLWLAGHLLGPSEGRRQWSLPSIATVTVTDRRLVHVCAGVTLTVVQPDGRHRRPIGRPRLVTGQIRWQWPSRLELADVAPGWEDELFVVCDALRTIRQPALALRGPTREVSELARQVQRAVATFRLNRPELVELAPPERDELLRGLVPQTFGPGRRVRLAGALPVEFLSRDDYYHPGARPEPVRPVAVVGTAQTVELPQPGRPGSAC